jgi:hypothetical protein
MAQVLTRKGDEFGDEILNHLLPDKYRIGAIVLEVDVWCERSDNRNRDLGLILGDIAVDKNEMLIQQRLDKEFQRWLEGLRKERLNKQTAK